MTVSFGGTAASHANSNDVANLTFSFQNAAFSEGDASLVTDATRSNLVIDFDDPPVISYSGTTFSEASRNNGTIANYLILTLTGDTFVDDGDFNEGDEYTVANEPAGLTLSVVRDSATQLPVNLTGTASSHTNANDVSDLTLALQDNAFSVVSAANITDASRGDLAVTYNDSTLTINTVPYRESFEDYAGGAQLGADQGWLPSNGNVVTSETAIVSALTGSFSTFPLTTNHTQVLRMKQETTAEIKSGSGDTVYTDVMLYMIARAAPPPGDRGEELCDGYVPIVCGWRGNSRG